MAPAARLALLLALSTFAQAQFDVKLSAKSLKKITDRAFNNLRVFERGSDQVKVFAKICKPKIDTFTQCFLGEREPEQAFGRNLVAKNREMMRTLTGHPEIQQLRLVTDNVLQCFSGCASNPEEASLCFLSYSLRGEPAARVTTCIAQFMGLGDAGDLQIPPLGQIKSFREVLEIFSAIGVYKAFRDDRSKFWGKVGGQVELLCPGRVLEVSACVEAAILGAPALTLDLAKILPQAQPLGDIGLGLDEQLDGLGDVNDLAIFKSFMFNSITGCILEYFSFPDSCVAFNCDSQ